jgi:DNA-binding transcriptional MerR regulator
MKPGEAADLLGIGRSTITIWTAGEYKNYLSYTAQGGEGRRRVLTETDVRILHFINLEKRNGTPNELIHHALRDMQKDDWEGLPPLPRAANVATVPVIPAAAAEAGIQAERKALLREIASLQERLENVETQLTDEQAGRRADIERLQSTMHKEIADLRAQLAEAQALNRLYESGRLKPAKDE